MSYFKTTHERQIMKHGGTSKEEKQKPQMYKREVKRVEVIMKYYKKKKPTKMKQKMR